eukprot:symbB.v1.2.016257.t2/scaffold1233.1/size237523/19
MAMSKTAAAAAVMAGTAFVSLPQRSATAPSAPRALREARGATHQSQGGRAMLSTVGLALGATAMATSRRFTTESGVGVTTRAFENELGVQPPLGFWDPAGLSSDGDAKEFYRRRVVEIKHGRVSMLACTGSSA